MQLGFQRTILHHFIDQKSRTVVNAEAQKGNHILMLNFTQPVQLILKSTNSQLRRNPKTEGKQNPTREIEVLKYNLKFSLSILASTMKSFHSGNKVVIELSFVYASKSAITQNIYFVEIVCCID